LSTSLVTYGQRSIASDSDAAAGAMPTPSESPGRRLRPGSTRPGRKVCRRERIGRWSSFRLLAGPTCSRRRRRRPKPRPNDTEYTYRQKVRQACNELLYKALEKRRGEE